MWRLRYAEARRLARLELGGVEQVKESVRSIRTGALVEQLLQLGPGLAQAQAGGDAGALRALGRPVSANALKEKLAKGS